MDIHLLTPTPQRSPNAYPGGGAITHIITVKGGDFYDARQRAFQDAEEQGVTRVAILCDGLKLIRRTSQGLNEAGPNDYHGMWLYTARLAASFGHVYVPPLALAPHLSNAGRVLRPTIPMVSVYSVKALQSVRDWWASEELGLRLCVQGYHSFTVGDYYFDEGRRMRTPLNTAGTVDDWTTAYRDALESILE